MSNSPPPQLVLARELRPEHVRQKCEFFVDAHLWPLHNELDVRGWLSNFRPEDEVLATHLLNAFVYVPNHFVDQMLMSNFRSLGRLTTEHEDSYADKKQVWNSFVNRMIVTFPTGEQPSPTDSGPEYARRTRQHVGVSEQQILEPGAVLEALAARAPHRTPVVFVDDFAGTGNQFADTWNRTYPGAPVASFDAAFAAGLVDPYYLPLFCSELGQERLKKGFPQVSLMPVHFLTSRYSALNPDGVVWPESLKSEGPSFIERESLRVGIPDTNGTATDDWRGFGRQGLAIAIGRSIPDATLPIFYWEGNGWHPLKRRS